MENSAEQGGGRRNPDGFRGRQRSYVEFYTTDVKGFYQRIVLKIIGKNYFKIRDNTQDLWYDSKQRRQIADN
jgi:hypothetical protein